MAGPTSAVVLVVDRLGAGRLGPYGNAWLPTPHLNRLASESFLCENCLADAPDLAAAYRAWWTGRHALEPAAQDAAALPNLARQRGLASVLITDEPEVARLPLAQHFDEHLLFESSVAERCAESIEETGLFFLMAAAIETLAERPHPLLAWIHARGLSAPWDGPYELRAAMADLDDPDPPRFVVPPEQRLAADFDPDEVLGVAQAHAGQVQVVDECAGLLLDALARHPQAGNLLFAFTAPRGYPLGEHARIGHCDGALYSELIHVPLLVRFPGREHRLSRVQTLHQPGDLWQTIASAWGEDRGTGFARHVADAAERRQVALIGSGDERAIRTPAWYLRTRQSRERSTAEEHVSELFAKPDDRWEANEVASRCPRVVQQLAEARDEAERAFAAGRFCELPPLPEELAQVWR